MYYLPTRLDSSISIKKSNYIWHRKKINHLYTKLLNKKNCRSLAVYTSKLNYFTLIILKENNTNNLTF